MQLGQREFTATGIPWSSRKDRPGEEPLIQRGCGEGVRFSLVHHAGIRHVFAAASACTGDLDGRGTAPPLEALARAIGRVGLKAEVVRQSVFTADPAMLTRLAADCGFEGGNRPVTDLFPQQPADGGPLAIEIWGVVAGKEDLAVERPAANLVLVRQPGMTMIHCGGVAPDVSGSTVHDQTIAGLEAMRTLLAEQGIGFDQVVRTWLYLGDIIGPDRDTQRYKELNRARSDFFATCALGANRSLSPATAIAYPASTGIGAMGRDLTLGCLALATDRRDVQVMPLENPRQISAHDYGAIYSPQSPKFSRAMAVEVGADAMILISGTASITKSETKHLGDAVAQTWETLANIEALIAEANLARHGLPGFGCTLANLAVARVYIKRQADYPAVRAICESRLGQVPVTYTVADVCRPQLLVEIEGIAFSRWGLASP